ncbi:MAG: hypothetical protein M3Q30_19295 [Actinomycetota bacterium]|nr:hypothetical protein [Actinomycetota bacterium]
MLDAAGRPVQAQFVVAAEWVGIVTTTQAVGVRLRFVPGGVAHALDPDENVVLCGVDPDGLEAFALDFAEDERSFRCAQCRRAAFANGEERV